MPTPVSERSTLPAASYTVSAALRSARATVPQAGMPSTATVAPPACALNENMSTSSGCRMMPKSVADATLRPWTNREPDAASGVAVARVPPWTSGSAEGWPSQVLAMT
jgi:hypothetical protein